MPLSAARYRAPSEPGLLCDPPLADIGRQLVANRARLDIETVRIDGAPLNQFRRDAAAEIAAAARQYLRDCGEPVPDFTAGSLLMSGHQPELTHVGVLIKTFALHALARKHGLTPINLIVDNDTTKTTSMRFAVLGSALPAKEIAPEAVHLQAAPYDDFEGEVMYEHRPIADPELFRSFADRTMPLTRNWGFEPLLPEVWAEMRRQYDRTPLLGEVVSATRRCYERRWGCHNLELPLSRLCSTNAFQRFARHLIADLPNFHFIYNDCVADYRRRHRVRSRNHPVPDLARNGDLFEAPFWKVRPNQERRSRLMVKAGELPEFADLRTRALTTTMFMRLCLADGFIHGIGGAHYDEVTDAIIKRWLGVEPPGYIVLTATLRLPLPTFPTTVADLGAAKRIVRDLDWNPQRYLKPADLENGEVRRLIAEKERLIQRKPNGKAERKIWFRQFAAVTEQLRPFVKARLEEAKTDLKVRQVEAHANEALMRRDFAWCLFPEELVSRFCRQFNV